MMQYKYPFYSISEIQKFFSLNSTHPKKKWGQNFLIDPNIIRKILQIPTKDQLKESSVIAEIGAGLGALTHELALFQKSIYVFEIDQVLIKNLLEQDYAKLSNFHIISGNVLENLHLINTHPTYFFGNLPYYISSEILITLVKTHLNIKGGVFLLQKEFVERITQEKSSLSIFLHAFGKWRLETTVSKNCFYPKPNVDSAIISFVPHEKRVLDFSKIENLEKLLRGFFWGKRKTIAKIVDSSPFLESIDKQKLKSILFDRLQKTGKERPEDLFDEYYEIAKIL